jgi:hypothetical protein
MPKRPRKRAKPEPAESSSSETEPAAAAPDAGGTSSSEEMLELPECKINQLCRIRRALFGHQEEPVPIPQLLHDVKASDLTTLNRKQLERMQMHIAAATLNKDDPRWLQFYIMLLMRDIDIMEMAVLDENEDSLEVLRRIALAIAQSKSSTGPLGQKGLYVPIWVLALAAGITLMLILIMLVMFGITLREVAVHK